jgi:hypothetical protein
VYQGFNAGGVVGVQILLMHLVAFKINGFINTNNDEIGDVTSTSC